MDPEVPVIGKFAVPVTVTLKVPDVDASVVESPEYCAVTGCVPIN